MVTRRRIVGRIEKSPSGGGFLVTVCIETPKHRGWAPGTPSDTDAAIEALVAAMVAAGARADRKLLAQFARQDLAANRCMRAEIVSVPAPRKAVRR
jgi:hypothetical protein